MQSFKKSITRANSLRPQEIRKYLTPDVPGLEWVTRRRTVEDDKAGIDYVVHRHNARPLFVDLKQVRRIPDKDDLVLLETRICGRKTTPGWATDPEKKTDLYLIIRGDGSTLVLSARRVREAISRHGRDWEKTFGCGSNLTKGYYEVFSSEYLLVPTRVLRAACDEIASEWRN